MDMFVKVSENRSIPTRGIVDIKISPEIEEGRGTTPRPWTLGPLFDLVACFLTPNLRLRARNVLALTGGGEHRVA